MLKIIFFPALDFLEICWTAGTLFVCKDSGLVVALLLFAGHLGLGLILKMLRRPSFSSARSKLAVFLDFLNLKACSFSFKSFSSCSLNSFFFYHVGTSRVSLESGVEFHSLLLFKILSVLLTCCIIRDSSTSLLRASLWQLWTLNTKFGGSSSSA